MRQSLLAGSILVLFGCGGADPGAGAYGASAGDVSSNGRATVALTGGTMAGGPADLQDATAVNVTVLGVQLLVAARAGAHLVPVTMDPATVNLLELRHDANALLGSAPVDGKITQIRMDVGGTAEVVFPDGTSRVATVPSSERTGIKIITNGLDASTVGTLTLRFDPARSIHETGGGRLVMRPTIKLGDVGDGTSAGGTDTTGGGSAAGGSPQGNGHCHGHGGSSGSSGSSGSGSSGGWHPKDGVVGSILN